MIFFKLKKIFVFCLTALLIIGCKEPISDDKQLKFLNTMLLKTEDNIQYENDMIYGKFVNNMKDMRSWERAKKFQPIAYNIRIITNDLIEKLDSIYLLIKNDSQYKIRDDEIAVIFDWLQNFKVKIDELFADIEGNLHSGGLITKDIFDSSVYSKKTFSNHLFAMRSKEASKATLTGIVNFIRLAEKELLLTCYSNTTFKGDTYGYNTYLISQSSSIVKPGEQIVLSAGIGAYSVSAQPQISINGKDIEVNHGFGILKFKAKELPGDYSIPVRITYTMNDGNKDTIETKIKYTVNNCSDPGNGL